MHVSILNHTSCKFTIPFKRVKLTFYKNKTDFLIQVKIVSKRQLSFAMYSFWIMHSTSSPQRVQELRLISPLHIAWPKSTRLQGEWIGDMELLREERTTGIGLGRWGHTGSSWAARWQNEGTRGMVGGETRCQGAKPSVPKTDSADNKIWD